MRCLGMLGLCCLLTMTPLTFAAEVAEHRGFEHAFYLETHQKDVAAAMVAYEKVLDDSSAPDAIRDEARKRLEECKEKLAATDLGRLMPPNAIAYVEINEPGNHLARLAKSLGLLDKPDSSLAGRSIPIDGDVAIPLDVTISPALLRELSKIRGAAFALTSLNFDADVPSGVMVLNMGESDLIRGLIETGIQFIRPDEAIEGFPTYNVDGKVWMTSTGHLLIASPSKREIEQAIARLHSSEAESFADSPEFKAFSQQRSDSLVFAYVGGEPIREVMRRELRGEEAMIANVMLDPQSLNHFVATLQVQDEEVELKAALNYQPGHRSLAYGLLQTEAIQGRSLRSIPKEVAGFVVVGMNPVAVSKHDTGRRSEVFSLLDIGREIFNNVTEVGAFVTAASGTNEGPPVPDFALVFSVNDADKSEGLWDQMLSLPSAVGMPEAQKRSDVRINGRTAKSFLFPDAPPLSLLRLDDSTIVFGTENAVKDAIEADEDKVEDARSVLAKLPQANKAIVVNVGNAIELAASMEPGSDRELMQVREAVQDMTVSLITDEQPNQLTVRLAVGELPNVRHVLERIAVDQESPSDR